MAAVILRRNHHRHHLAFSSLICSPLQGLMVERRKWNHTMPREGKDSEIPMEGSNAASERGCFNPSTWKKVDSRSLGIKTSAIDSSVWMILRVLKQKGFGAYLVGGCVRDLILDKIPKDFDVVTTANLKQIGNQFRRTMKIGRRFPLRLVYMKGSWIEVSSFETDDKNANERQKTLFPDTETSCELEDLARWRDCMRRDFTINGLLYDPSTNTIYDYVNGIEDIRASKVRTVAPANLSFKEDCARILRGIRIGARLGLKFSKKTRVAMLDYSPSIRSLDKARLMLEMNYMLAYGAAVPSIHLLQRFKLLEVLLPFHAAYLSQAGNQTNQASNLLMTLFSSVDKILAADHPSDCSLWLGLLAFHLSLVAYPQDALTVWTFASILYHGKLGEAVKFARENTKNCIQFVPEISVISGTKSDKLLLEEVSHFASLVRSSVNVLTCSDALIKSIERYQMPSMFSGLVFVSKKMGRHVVELFDVLDAKTTFTERRTYDINYELLKSGDPIETRFVLGKVIMDALNSEFEKTQTVSENRKKGNWRSIKLELEQKQAISIKEEQNQMCSRNTQEQNKVILEQKEETNETNSRKLEQNKVITKKRKERNQDSFLEQKQNRNTTGKEKVRDHKDSGTEQTQEQAVPKRKKERKLVTSIDEVGQNQMNIGTKLENQDISEKEREGNQMSTGIKQEKHQAISHKGNEQNQTVFAAEKEHKTLSKLFR